MTRPRSGYALLAGLLLTLVVVGLDLASPRAAVPETLRSAGAALTGPILTTMADTFPPPTDNAVAATQAQAELSMVADDLHAARDSAALLETDDVRQLRGTDHRIVLARVVAIGALGPAGPERLTIDVGSEDGVALDQTVVATTRSRTPPSATTATASPTQSATTQSATTESATTDPTTTASPTPTPTTAGLVGRTVRVGATTSDVLILGAADLVVGARGAESGLLGTVGPPRSGSPEPREQGQLTFAAIGFGDIAIGELLRTVGSPGEQPFVAGVTIGTVTAVDPTRGRVGLTAAVTPAVDVARLDVVAVIAPQPASAEP